MTDAPLPAQPLAHVPCVQLKRVVHIGSMDAADKGLHGDSLEGSGLSFSKHPEAWQRIARLGGWPWWEARLDGWSIVDGHALIAEQGPALIAWGVAHGWVTPITAYELRWYDDEMEDEVMTLLGSLEEAQAEQDGNDAATITPVQAWAPTARLLTAMRHAPHLEGKPALQVEQDLATVWAEANGHRGIWWSDRLDPDAWSAPRGVIFAAFVPEAGFQALATPDVDRSRKKSPRLPGG